MAGVSLLSFVVRGITSMMGISDVSFPAPARLSSRFSVSVSFSPFVGGCGTGVASEMGGGLVDSFPKNRNVIVRLGSQL